MTSADYNVCVLVVVTPRTMVRLTTGMRLGVGVRDCFAGVEILTTSSEAFVAIALLHGTPFLE